MLVVHPSSTCDVCLERYSWDDADCTPHSISCGHVFCLRCLTNLTAPTCPLCRRLFHIERARKLHVDLASDDPSFHQSSNDIEANQLGEELADVCDEGASDDACRAVIEHILGWLEPLPMDAHRFLRESVGLLHRHKILKENFNILRVERDDLQQKMNDVEHERAQERLMARGLEDSYETRMAELCREHHVKVNNLEASLRQAELQLAEYEKPLRNNPLPAPPEPISQELLAALYQARPKPSKSNGALHGSIPESSSLAVASRRPVIPPYRSKSPLPLREDNMGPAEPTQPKRQKDVVVPPKPDYMSSSTSYSHAPSAAGKKPLNPAHSGYSVLAKAASHLRTSIASQAAASSSSLTPVDSSTLTANGRATERPMPRRAETSSTRRVRSPDIIREETPRAQPPQRRATEPFPTLNVLPLFQPQGLSSQESLASTITQALETSSHARHRERSQRRSVVNGDETWGRSVSTLHEDDRNNATTYQPMLSAQSMDRDVNSSRNSIASFDLLNPATAPRDVQTSRNGQSENELRAQQMRQLLNLLVVDDETDGRATARPGGTAETQRVEESSARHLERQSQTRTRSHRVDERSSRRSSTIQYDAPVPRSDRASSHRQSASMTNPVSYEREARRQSNASQGPMVADGPTPTPTTVYPTPVVTNTVYPVDDREISRPAPATSSSRPRRTSQTQPSQSRPQYGYAYTGNHASNEAIPYIAAPTFPGGYASSTAFDSWAAAYQSSSRQRTE